ncbi:hypothetical protein [Acinetobacter sp. YH12145]|uniref:hypothetical protein n=1 Tax=Acinetobacter sp. YH12145 TaxID=2601129 RepID=UPI0015D35903|nr:hypothetical protein [Acinetobacter sp. YH12145]
MTIQSLVLFILIAVVVEGLLPMLTLNMEEAALEQLTTVKDLSFEVIISCYIYWRIYKAMRQIHQPV